jgi:hypothetical protein
MWLWFGRPKMARTPGVSCPAPRAGVNQSLR